MNRRWLTGVVAAGLLVLVPPGAGAQPRPAAPPVAPQQPQRPDVPAIDDRSAQEVRQQLNELLRDYPPSLAQVLRLDPSLMTREGYLDPYPRLASFIAQHPDITLHPAFYLGSPNNFGGEEDARSRAIRAAGGVMTAAFVVTGFIAFFMLLGWVARLISEHRRWLRASKTQTDVHSKLFDRLSSNEDLLAYIQTPAGQHFLQSAPIAVDTAPRALGAPIGRILWSVQAGIVLVVVGAGLWLVKNSIVPELAGPLNVVAVLIMALGAGFALSAGIAYMLSLRLGLLEQPRQSG